MSKQSLLYGAIILLISNSLIKCLGFSYRVFLVRVLGTEGIGLVEMVFPFYTFIIVITTWGIPLAMSKILAEETARGNWGNVQRIFRLTLFLLTASGLITTTLVIYFAPWIMAHFAADQRIYFCFVAMIPAVFIISVCSVFRAYFQGTKEVSAIGYGQAIEQILRVVVGITLALHLRKYGLEIAVVGVSLGSVVGELSGMVYLMARYRRQKRIATLSPTLPRYQIIKGLFTFGTPVTMTRLLASFLMTLQASLIPRGLMMAGNDLRTATEIYGRFSGVALSLLHLPGIVTMSMAVSIIPAVAELSGRGNRELLKHRVSESLWITSVFCVPSMVVLYYYAGELCSLIFHAPPAGEPLRILALGGIFCYLQQTLTSILQGLGKVKMLLVNNIFSGFCLIGGILLLTPIPGLEIKGAAIALALSYFTGCSLNLLYLITNGRINLPLTQILAKPIIIGFVSFWGLKILDPWLRLVFHQLPLAMIISILLIAFFYFIFLFCIGGLPTHTIKRLPIINKFFT
jgi:stage V sporulation protein B